MANFKLIKEIASEKGIPIRSLAKGIGISESQLHHLVKTRSTNTRTLEAIAQFLGTSVSVFFDEGPATLSEEKARIKELEKENAHLRQLLAEKERTIQILTQK